jgi:DNA (cytosine-5)-methyltransferase 1
MRQLGNAVPAPLGTAAGRWLAELVARGAGPLVAGRRAA